MFAKSAIFLIQLTVVLTCASLNAAEESDYIVGGANAAPGEIPYQVSLQYNKRHNCGGSIIKNCWILTAAHCVVGFRQSALDILAGTTKLNSGGVRVAIDKIIPHKFFNKFNGANDIAVIKLKKCLVFNENITSVKLLTTNIGADVAGIVSGWGFTDQSGKKATNDLKWLEVKTISNQQCSKPFRIGRITKGNICALNRVGEGFCQGDSGGPLVEKKSKEQIGLVSANVPCARGKPDIYTRISTYIKWIEDNSK